MGGLTRTQRRALVAVVALGFAVRVVWCVAVAREPQGLHDEGFYRYLADRLASFDGYEYPDGPTAYYPPGYPLVLAVAFAAGNLVGADGSGAQTALVAAVNVTFGTAAIVLTYLLGRRVTTAWAAIAAAAVVAVLPNLVFHSAVALTETTFVAAALGGALLLAGPSPGTRRLLAAGALLGAAALIRPVVLPVVPLLLLLPWRAGRLRTVALVGAAAVAVLLPWTARNALRMDAFVPISTNTGDNLCMSRQPGATGGFLLTEHCFGGPELEGLARPESELERDEQGRRLAAEFVRDHPGREVRLWLDRVGATFRHDHDALDSLESYGDDVFLADGTRDVLRRLADGAWYVLGPLSLAAAAVAVGRRDRRHGELLLLVFAVGILLPVVAFFGDARFKVPALPFLSLLVCATAARAPTARSLPGRRSSSS